LVFAKQLLHAGMVGMLTKIIADGYRFLKNEVVGKLIIIFVSV